MQHARYAKKPIDNDLSAYLRQNVKAGSPRHMEERNGNMNSGNMDNVGTTLVVGRRWPEKKTERNEPERRNDKDQKLKASQNGTESLELSLVLFFHEYGAYSEELVVDPSGFESGGIYEMVAAKKQGKPLVFRVYERNFVLKNAKQKSISLNSSLQKVLGLPQRTAVTVRRVLAVESVELDTVEVYLKDVNFSRDLQWSLSSRLVGTCCHVDQRLLYLGSRVGLIRFLFKDGKKMASGYIGLRTNVVFRSESGKMVFLIQLAREMWHFEENGEIMFHKLVNNLFPMIFKKWRAQASHHAITIVLFTSVDLTDLPWISLGAGERPSKCQDYYRVVVDQVSVFIWDKIMANLRLEFANFKRDILLHRENGHCSIQGEPCPTVKGNLLEAINLALTQVTDRNKDTDLRHSVNHMVVVSPGTGLFDVDYALMLETSRKMFSLDCALDIVCLSQPPLHTVPLFRYKDAKGELCHVVPKWCDVSFYAAAKNSVAQWVSRCKIYELQMMGLMENELKDIQLSRITFKEHVPVVEAMDLYDEELFRPVRRLTKKKEKPVKNTVSLPFAKLSGFNMANTSASGLVTNTCVSGLVTNTSVSNSALSSLYTLNKAGEGREEEKEKVPTKTPKVQPKIQELHAKSYLNSLAESLVESKASFRRKEKSEKRPSAIELEKAEREENNPYWMVVKNPSRPQKRNTSCSRWLDVIPPSIHRKLFRWRSLKAPAALPIGTTLFPTNAEIEADYIFQIYVVSLNQENRLELKSTKDLMREMIRLRLAMGFQICYGDKVKKVEAQRKSGGYPEGIVKYFPSGDCSGVRIYLSLNEEIHRLFYDYNGSLNVQLFRKQAGPVESGIQLGSRSVNTPLIRTRYADEFSPSKLEKLNPWTVNWNQYDQLLAGYEDALKESNTEMHKMKFVILPGEISLNAYNINNERLSDEEIRLEGLRKLITLIEKGRYEKKNTKEQMLPEIHFYTGNLHDFLSEQAEYFDLSGKKPTNSLMLGLRFNMNIRLDQLAAELQAPGGIKLVDRTWHFKMHPHCFLGSDLVTWLVKSFEDLEEREPATEYGQLLMDQGLFSHVEERHGFLDGHYFYEFTKDYVDNAYKKKSKGWFRKKADEKGEKEESPENTRHNSIDSNIPHVQSLLLDSIELRKTISLHLQEHSESSSLSDSQKPRKKKKFLISKPVKYNCDPLGKSFRPELIDIHYDSVHNPEHCYHIRLQWLNTSMKFIDETIIGWSRFCERYGLKLVETPWRELCTIPETSPFHSFVDLKLAVNPLSDAEFQDCEILKTNKFYFHLHFLKVADFLLDNRGTSFFARDSIEICYSWGKSQFKFAQFIHKTGAYIVELRENGEFFLAPNNIHISRLSTMVNLMPDSSEYSFLDSQQVMLKFRDSCKNEAFLRQVFRDAMKYLSEDYDAAYVDGM